MSGGGGGPGGWGCPQAAGPGGKFGRSGSEVARLPPSGRGAAHTLLPPPAAGEGRNRAVVGREWKRLHLHGSGTGERRLRVEGASAGGVLARVPP